MIYRFSDWDWEGIEPSTYKDEPGTWMSVVRRAFTDGAETSFEVRYFEVAPDGYTSWEKHQHEHLVVVLRGSGHVRFEDGRHSLSLHDVVRVESGRPHQFLAGQTEPLGILCIVDRTRDRPVLLEPDGGPRASNT